MRVFDLDLTFLWVSLRTAANDPQMKQGIKILSLIVCYSAHAARCSCFHLREIMFQL